MRKELQSINWNEVDEFPSVDECEKIEDKALRQQCFFEFLAQTIQTKLSADTLKMLSPKMDTLQLRITIFPNSTLKFEAIPPKDVTKFDPIKVDSLLKVELIDLPKINPAIKRGIPVKTQFVLPIVIKAE